MLTTFPITTTQAHRLTSNTLLVYQKIYICMILSGGWTAVTGQLIDGDIFHCYIFVCFSHHRDPLFPSVRALDEDRMNRGEQAKINLEVFCLVD